MALSTLTVALGLIGSLLAPVTLRPAQFVSLLLVGAFIGSFAAMLARSVSEDRPLDTPQALAQAGRNAAVGAVWAVAAGVVVFSLGSYGWAVVVASALAYPLVRVVLRGLKGRPTTAQERVALAEGVPPAVGAFPARGERARLSTPPFERCSTAELAAAWGASYDLLQATSSPRMKARLVALRGAYLDELERRDRLGVRRWLAFADDPASDTGPFFRGSDDGGEPRPGVASE
jgi:hypothetical protein